MATTTTTDELVNGKGRRVELAGGMTATLMSKSPAKGYTAFYVRLDDEKRRVIVNQSRIVRFI